MPTIHIHLDDNDQALGIVAAMLNIGAQITIDLDEMDASTETGPKPFKVNGKAVTRRQYIDHKRAEADAVIAERDAEHEDKVLRDIHRARRAAERQNRDAARDQQRREAFEAMDVECPSCGALVDHPCLRPTGQPHSGYAHIDRVRASLTARGR